MAVQKRTLPRPFFNINSNHASDNLFVQSKFERNSKPNPSSGRIHLPVIQRLSPGTDFTISGLPSEDFRKKNPNFIFFDRKSSTIPAEEADKVSAFAKSNFTEPSLNLYGYASEEGNDKENKQLIKDRMNEVDTRLHLEFAVQFNDSYKGKIKQIPRLKAGRKKIDYRAYRAVEMQQGASSRKKKNTRGKLEKCTKGESDLINKAAEAGKETIKKAIEQVGKFEKDPANHTQVQAIIGRHFHSHSAKTIKTLLKKLNQAQSKLSKFTEKRRKCGPQY